MTTNTSPVTSTSPRLTKALRAAIAAAADRQARDIVVLDLKKVGGFTDYFLLCTAQNTKQIGAIADAIEVALKDLTGERPAIIEGRAGAEWVLLDYGPFVVHVFNADQRAFYKLDRLWADCEKVPIRP